MGTSKDLKEFFQVASVTIAVGRKMQLEHYGGKKYESEDLFASLTIKERNTEEKTPEELDLLRKEMFTEARRIASDELKSMVRSVKGGKFMSEDGTMDTAEIKVEPDQKWTPRAAATCKDLAQKNGVMARVFEKVPNSCTIIDQIKTAHKWHMTPTGMEKLMMKYDSNDQVLRAALVTMRDLPKNITAHFAAVGDNIDVIETVVFETCEGEMSFIEKWVKADKRLPSE